MRIPGPEEPRFDEGQFETQLYHFVEELRAHRHSLSRQRQARHVVSLFFSHLRENGVQELQAVTEAEVVAFARFLGEHRTRRGRPLASWSQAAYLSILRRFFDFLDKRSVVLRNPAAGLRLPRAQRLPRALLSQAQVRRLLEAPSWSSSLGQRDRAMLETFYGTGVRLSECIQLDVTDADLQRAELWIRDGKGKKDRLLPIPLQSLEAIDIYMKEARPSLLHHPNQPALFLSRLGRRVSSSLVHAVLDNHGKAAGIPHRVHPHALRHAYATHLLQRGADVRHIQELLGHSWLQTTTVYTKVQVEDLKRMLSRAHPREKSRKK